MVEFVLERNHLVLKLNDLPFAVDELRLFVFEIERFLIYQLVQVIDPSKLLLDIILQSSCLSREISALFALQVVLMVEVTYLIRVLSVSFSQIMEFVLEVLFLSKQL